MPAQGDKFHGRGAASNPPNRFMATHAEVEVDPSTGLGAGWSDVPEADRPAPRTQFLRDTSQTIIAYNDSPDVGFNASVNPYRGCEHGCIYWRRCWRVCGR